MCRAVVVFVSVGRLVRLSRGGQYEKWPTCGQGGYATPATSGMPTASERGAESEVAHLSADLGFYGVKKFQNKLQSQILLFLSNYTIKSIFSGVSPPPRSTNLEIFEPLDRQRRLDSI